MIGSGHVTHNLRDWSLHRHETAPIDYVVQFSDWLHQRLVSGAALSMDAYLFY